MPIIMHQSTCRVRMGATGRVVSVLSALFTLSIAALADAPASHLSIRPDSVSGSDPRPAFTLQWDAVSNGVYKLQRRSSFDTNTPWETLDLVTPTGNLGIFKLTPEKVESNSESIRRGFF